MRDAAQTNRTRKAATSVALFLVSAGVGPAILGLPMYVLRDGDSATYWFIALPSGVVAGLTIVIFYNRQGTLDALAAMIAGGFSFATYNASLLLDYSIGNSSTWDLGEIFLALVWLLVAAVGGGFLGAAFYPVWLATTLLFKPRGVSKAAQAGEAQ